MKQIDYINENGEEEYFLIEENNYGANIYYGDGFGWYGCRSERTLEDAERWCQQQILRITLNK